VEVESINGKTDRVEDSDDSCKNNSAVKVKRYHDRQFPEYLRVANRDELRAGEDLYYRDEGEYDTDRGALWQVWRRYRRWTGNAVAS
jgi:hypothetical protein